MRSISKKALRRRRLVIVNLFFIILCVVGLIPILYTLMLSFSGEKSALSTSLSLIPRHPSLQNYKVLLFQKPFLKWTANSILISISTVAISMAVSVPASYAFSRFRYRGRKKMMEILLFLNAFPSVLSMFALFRLFRLMNMLNSYIGLIMIYAGSMCIFGIWNMKGYFDAIPVEIEESAKIDGANNAQLIIRIVLPLARPAIIVTSILVLIYVWNEYLFATTFLLNENSYTLAGGLYQLQASDYSRSWSLFSAAAILVSVPLLIVFFLVQKYMVSGLTAGGVKG